MEERFSRYGALIGEEGIAKLRVSKVAVFGVGGVGGEAIIALARAGIGHLVVIDHDVVAPSNLNRQIVATRSTLYETKVEIIKKMILDVSGDCIVESHDVFFEEKNKKDFDFASYSYVIDAIDSIDAKVALIKTCFEMGVPIISALGAGNKTHPEMLQIADIYQTSVDPLARVMRTRLRKIGIPSLKVVYSLEEPYKVNLEEGGRRKAIPGSSPFVPNAMGLILASAVCEDLLK